MLEPKRLSERLVAVGLSQAELARIVGISQQAVGKLVNGRSRSTSHIARIARALSTTAAYLEGEIDDPDKDAPVPPLAPTIQHIMMPVALPSEPALAQMFEGLLECVDLSAPLAELAQELAELLPTALSAVRGRPLDRAAAPPVASAEAVPALATADHEST